MFRAVYQRRRTVTCLQWLLTLTESDSTVVLQQKCDNATFISTTTTTTTTTRRQLLNSTVQSIGKYRAAGADHISLCSEKRRAM